MLDCSHLEGLASCLSSTDPAVRSAAREVVTLSLDHCTGEIVTVMAKALAASWHAYTAERGCCTSVARAIGRVHPSVAAAFSIVSLGQPSVPQDGLASSQHSVHAAEREIAISMIAGGIAAEPGLPLQALCPRDAEEVQRCLRHHEAASDSVWSGVTSDGLSGSVEISDIDGTQGPFHQLTLQPLLRLQRAANIVAGNPLDLRSIGLAVRQHCLYFDGQGS